MGHVIGIDLGTQSVKVAMVGADGVVEASATRPYAVHSAHPGWAESDPEAWLDAALDAANEVLAVAGARPVGIGLSGQMHGVVLCERVVHLCVEPLPGLTRAVPRRQHASPMYSGSANWRDWVPRPSLASPA